jgi:carbonic anhydrase
MKKVKGSILLLSFFLLVSCTSNSNNEMKTAETKDNCEDVKWSHKAGPNGPENWKNLCDGFSDCGGKAQSPIDIVTASVSSEEKLDPISLNYSDSKFNILNNGHTVQFNIEGNNTATIQGKEYSLLQFHYHAKSEHTVDGNYFPLEVHFVHKHSDDDFAVIGIMFEEGAENDLLSKYLEDFPKSKGTFNSEDMLDLNSLFPESLSYFHYNGSLTTPPCSEVVNWYLLKQPVQASKEQLTAFAEILDNNYRPVMALNDRTVHSFEE